MPRATPVSPFGRAAGGRFSRPPWRVPCYGASVVEMLLSLLSAHTVVEALRAANASRIASAMRFITSPPFSPIETQRVGGEVQREAERSARSGGRVRAHRPN